MFDKEIRIIPIAVDLIWKVWTRLWIFTKSLL